MSIIYAGQQFISYDCPRCRHYTDSSAAGLVAHMARHIFLDKLVSGQLRLARPYSNKMVEKSRCKNGCKAFTEANGLCMRCWRAWRRANGKDR